MFLRDGLSDLWVILYEIFVNISNVFEHLIARLYVEHVVTQSLMSSWFACFVVAAICLLMK